MYSLSVTSLSLLHILWRACCLIQTAEDVNECLNYAVVQTNYKVVQRNYNIEEPSEVSLGF